MQVSRVRYLVLGSPGVGIGVADLSYFRIGSSSVAVGVLQHVAAEYMTNLGRTLKFYSDRYGSKMTPEVRKSLFLCGVMNADNAIYL